MDYYGIAFVLLGIIAIVMGYLAFTRPNSFFAKFTITLFRIDHRIKGVVSIIFGIILTIVGILYYFQ